MPKKLKEFYREHSYIHHLDSILLHQNLCICPQLGEFCLIIHPLSTIL